MNSLRFPVASASLTAGILAVSFAPGAAVALEYDRAAVAAGEIWRPLTGQLVHWTPRMTLVDTGAVLLLGALLERFNRRLLVATVAVALVVVGTGIHLLAPQVYAYRGASGLASALCVAVAVQGIATARTRSGIVLAALALGLFGTKLAWELATGTPLAAGRLPDGVGVLSLAHALGAVAGAATVWAALAFRHRSTSGAASIAAAPAWPGSRSSNWRA